PLLQDGNRPFSRRVGNWLVQIGGRPVLLVEQHGKRLTAMPSAAPEDLGRAVALLPGIIGPSQKRDFRHKLTVEAWNEQPVTASQGKEYLESAGFVRDYQSMTLYSVWK